MTSILSYALTNVSDVKESLGITNSTQDNLITRKINQATDMIESYCQLPKDHHFVSTSYTNEEYDGPGINQLSLKMRPVTSMSSFQYRNTLLNTSAWADVNSQYYFLDSNAGVIDIITHLTKLWNAYRVTYTAGYITLPSDLSEACASLAGYLTQNHPGGQVKLKREGQRQIDYYPATTSNPDSLIKILGLQDMLNRYINYAIMEDK